VGGGPRFRVDSPTRPGGHGGQHSGAGAWWLSPMQQKHGGEALGGLVGVAAMPYPGGGSIAGGTGAQVAGWPFVGLVSFVSGGWPAFSRG